MGHPRNIPVLHQRKKTKNPDQEKNNSYFAMDKCGKDSGRIITFKDSNGTEATIYEHHCVRNTEIDGESLCEEATEEIISTSTHKAEQGPYRAVIKEYSWSVSHYHSLPKWLQDNHHLHYWHRPPLNSFKRCFLSLFRWHTETVNMWTHLLGSLLFVGLAAYYLSGNFLEFEDKIVFGVFFLSAICCMSFSFVYHTVFAHSSSVAMCFSKLDYFGIAWMIIGSCISGYYYGFYCYRDLQIMYCSLVTILGICCIVVSFSPEFPSSAYRSIRASLFMVLGFSALVPIVHFFSLFGWTMDTFYRGSMGWLALMAMFYFAGAFNNVLRYPERRFPGKCDIVGHSHQIFHICVILGALCHLRGLINLVQVKMITANCTSQ